MGLATPVALRTEVKITSLAPVHLAPVGDGYQALVAEIGGLGIAVRPGEGDEVVVGRACHGLRRRRYQGQIMSSVLADSVTVGLPRAIPLHAGPAAVIGSDDNSFCASILIAPLPVGPSSDADALPN